MEMRRLFGILLAASMLLPTILAGCANPGVTPTEPAETEPTNPAPIEPEKEVYHGMTPSQLDAIPCVNYNDFRKAMDSGWNFGWDTAVSTEAVANKVDFLGAADDQKLWHVGTDGENSKVGNSGWGVELSVTGKDNVAFMYNKVRIPASTTEFRVWAVGNTDYRNSGEGAMRTVIAYKDENGEYVTQVMTPLPTSFTGSRTTEFHEEDGTIRFKNAKWNMPDTLDGCMIKYDISNLPKDQDVIIFIESVGMGNVLGDEYTEAAEGTPAGEVMSDLVVVKRVILVASNVPVDEGTQIDVPTDDSEQELLFKIANQEGLYLNFLPPITPKYEKAPVMLVICGGGYRDQSRSSILSMMSAMVADLRADGFAVIAADYRVITDTNGLMLDQLVTDLMDALRYVAHYADVLGIDPERIATSGHSAGAHLALMVAHAPQDSFPGVDFNESYKVFACAPFAARAVIHGSIRMYAATANGVYHRDIAELCSSINHVRADNAPTLIIHGNMDEVIPFSEAEKFIAKANEVGAPYELLVSEYGNHSFVSAIRGKKASPDLTEANHIAADWIVQQLEILNAK